ncbi:CoA transferase [Nocardioides campestrisoli]|uniref:CoA transferase n=1 Tax=Nocardioides campestrisoli TaxID=2736757 RepID=UPI0015E66113|nr:CoA transferase [Nocardioides campestrisoli]
METRPWLAATLPVLDLATSSVEAVRRASVAAGATGRVVDAPLDPERVAGAFGSDKLFQVHGRSFDGFAPLSGFFSCADGWVRTHANYPHHAARLLALLDLGPDAGREAAAAALGERHGQELEDAAAAAGALVVRVRSEEEWRTSEPGRRAAEGPLVATRVREDARHATLAGGARPLAGVRVLDLTRVLAGPVCTRTLALLGADVLRIDPPHLPEIEWQHLDTGQGKRSALLDLRHDLAAAQELLDRADVLVTGYRPGAIEAFGLEVPPGAAHARVNAWGDSSPWAARRGFDSLVQAASGIALVEGADDRPGALPAQALDHATGYLLAAAIIDALAGRAADGLGRDVSASLARTAAWLLDAPGRTPDHPAPAVPATTVTHDARTTARPAVPGFDDHPAPARPWGRDLPAW